MTVLNLDNLREMGGFVGPPVEKEIHWSNGDEEFTATVYVRRMSYRSVVARVQNLESEDDAMAAWLASCICDQKGNPIFTVGDITGEADPERGPLSSNLTVALIGAANEVNDLSKNSES